MLNSNFQTVEQFNSIRFVRVDLISVCHLVQLSVQNVPIHGLCYFKNSYNGEILDIVIFSGNRNFYLNNVVYMNFKVCKIFM